VTTTVLRPEEFGAVVSKLRSTGVTRQRTQGDGSLWVDGCPLPRDSPIDTQLEWAVAEAEIVTQSLGAERADLRVEVWLAVAVAAQRGFVCAGGLIARLAKVGADLVVDLYGWD
jgi:hypothetical protein